MQKTVTTYSDDLDGSEHPSVQARRFSLAGQAYEIDLHDDNYEQLGKALEPFVVAARPVFARAAAPARTRSPQRRSRTREIRSWAQEQGLEVQEQGRLSSGILRAYDAAQGALRDQQR